MGRTAFFWIRLVWKVSPPSASGGDTKDQFSVGQHLGSEFSPRVPQLRASSETLGHLEHGAFGLS